ncbi:MAG: GNAT family acetyltransferase [Chloroflexi bacterium]|nr:GNAT family acetyltransferase [Chloroflexota bacterium]
MDIEIRPYVEADEPAVVALWREVFPHAPAWNDPAADIRRKLAVQRELFLVASRGSHIVGTAMGGYDGHRGWVYYVVVSPRHRRQGIGTALMNGVEERLAEMGCPKVNLQVRASNEEPAPMPWPARRTRPSPNWARRCACSPISPNGRSRTRTSRPSARMPLTWRSTPLQAVPEP